jgi:hypothetical protein
MAASILRLCCALIFFVNQVLVCCYCSHTFELCHISKLSSNCLNVMILFLILTMGHQHILRFLCVYIQTNLLLVSHGTSVFFFMVFVLSLNILMSLVSIDESWCVPFSSRWWIIQKCHLWRLCLCCILLCVTQNSIFVSVNTTIQVKVITKVIYINVNHNMFRPLLDHQVYLRVLRCWVFVQICIHIFLHICLYDLWIR